MTTQPTLPEDEMAARRASARRTALIFAGVAVAVYITFMILNAVAQ
jgi:hypothetical protein